ncbi:hypothetical protein P7C73_g4478, partial [Tremellales sp. Uapishka_1]
MLFICLPPPFQRTDARAIRIWTECSRLSPREESDQIRHHHLLFAASPLPSTPTSSTRAQLAPTTPSPPTVPTRQEQSAPTPSSAHPSPDPLVTPGTNSSSGRNPSVTYEGTEILPKFLEILEEKKVARPLLEEGIAEENDRLPPTLPPLSLESPFQLRPGSERQAEVVQHQLAEAEIAQEPKSLESTDDRSDREIREEKERSDAHLSRFLYEQAIQYCTFEETKWFPNPNTQVPIRVLRAKREEERAKSGLGLLDTVYCKKRSHPVGRHFYTARPKERSLILEPIPCPENTFFPLYFLSHSVENLLLYNDSASYSQVAHRSVYFADESTTPFPRPPRDSLIVATPPGKPQRTFSSLPLNLWHSQPLWSVTIGILCVEVSRFRRSLPLRSVRDPIFLRLPDNTVIPSVVKFPDHVSLVLDQTVDGSVLSPEGVVLKFTATQRDSRDRESKSFLTLTKKLDSAALAALPPDPIFARSYEEKFGPVFLIPGWDGSLDPPRRTVKPRVPGDPSASGPIISQSREDGEKALIPSVRPFGRTQGLVLGPSQLHQPKSKPKSSTVTPAPLGDKGGSEPQHNRSPANIIDNHAELGKGEAEEAIMTVSDSVDMKNGNPPAATNGTVADHTSKGKRRAGITKTAPADILNMVQERIGKLEEKNKTEEEEEIHIQNQSSAALASVSMQARSSNDPYAALENKFTEMHADYSRKERDFGRDRYRLQLERDIAKKQCEKATMERKRFEEISRTLAKERNLIREDHKKIEARLRDIETTVQHHLQNASHSLASVTAKQAAPAEPASDIQHTIPMTPFKPRAVDAQPEDILVSVSSRYRGDLWFRIPRRKKLRYLFESWRSKMMDSTNGFENPAEPKSKIKGFADKTASAVGPMQLFVFTLYGRVLEEDFTPDELQMCDHDEIVAFEMLDLTEDLPEGIPVSTAEKLAKQWPSNRKDAKESLEEMLEIVIRERLKSIVRQYDLREAHWVSIMRSKDLELLIAQARLEANAPLFTDFESGPIDFSLPSINAEPPDPSKTFHRPNFRLPTPSALHLTMAYQSLCELEKSLSDAMTKFMTAHSLRKTTVSMNEAVEDLQKVQSDFKLALGVVKGSHERYGAKESAIEDVRRGVEMVAERVKPPVLDMDEVD